MNKLQMSATLALLSRSTLIVLALGFCPLCVHIHAYNTGTAGFSYCLQVEHARHLFNIASNKLQFLYNSMVSVLLLLQFSIISSPHTSFHLCSEFDVGL